MTNLAKNTGNTTLANSNAKIFLTDYASYNNGTQFEFGHWVDLTDFNDADELMEYINNHFEEADNESPLPCGTPREEIMITDFENFPKYLYSESMNTEDFEKVYKYIELDYENLSDNEKIGLWNEYCSENGYEDEIMENDEDFFNTYFENNPESAVRAAFYGDYRYMDTYVKFNGYGNLESFNNALDIITENDLIQWLIENK